jgi:hypothetical protein
MYPPPVTPASETIALAPLHWLLTRVAMIDRSFVTEVGGVDLIGLTNTLGPDGSREYFQMCQAIRAHRRKN